MTAVARSYLFVPGNRPERFEKALKSGADALIVDLEDAVPPQDKASARTVTSDWLARQSRGDTQLLVRINAAATEWFADDLAACSHRALDGIVLPKAESVDELAKLSERLGGGVALLPLIETAQGFARAGELAAAPAVQRLVFGTIDFQLDLGIEGEELELLYFRSQLVLWSRLAGIAAPVDGVTTSLDDEAQIHADAQRGRRLGFGAKLCIHPRQLAAVHRAYRPSAEEVAWARRVVEAADAAQGAAVALDGKMVDRPVILKAREILAAIK
ncbi:MAG TPA: CoA ester lyase [Burkholderiaceae bacterium]|nr:CoA ester lyase [Burkholderiaceae bacterium]